MHVYYLQLVGERISTRNPETVIEARLLSPVPQNKIKVIMFVVQNTNAAVTRLNEPRYMLNSTRQRRSSTAQLINQLANTCAAAQCTEHLRNITYK